VLVIGFLSLLVILAAEECGVTMREPQVGSRAQFGKGRWESGVYQSHLWAGLPQLGMLQKRSGGVAWLSTYFSILRVFTQYKFCYLRRTLC
jgi:hypothetical protein